jgi:hypothetical protein
MYPAGERPVSTGLSPDGYTDMLTRIISESALDQVISTEPSANNELDKLFQLVAKRCDF